MNAWNEHASRSAEGHDALVRPGAFSRLLYVPRASRPGVTASRPVVLAHLRSRAVGAKPIMCRQVWLSSPEEPNVLGRRRGGRVAQLMLGVLKGPSG